MRVAVCKLHASEALAGQMPCLKTLNFDMFFFLAGEVCNSQAMLSVYYGFPKYMDTALQGSAELQQRKQSIEAGLKQVVKGAHPERKLLSHPRPKPCIRL
eukprot:2102805-Amphidinium_carterae.1